MLNRTECVCGEKLENFINYKPFKFDDKFYGGRVSMTADITCKCGRELKGYFENRGSLKLIDLEITKDIENAKDDGEEKEPEGTPEETPKEPTKVTKEKTKETKSKKK